MAEPSGGQGDSRAARLRHERISRRFQRLRQLVGAGHGNERDHVARAELRTKAQLVAGGGVERAPAREYSSSHHARWGAPTTETAPNPAPGWPNYVIRPGKYCPRKRRARMNPSFRGCG